MERTLSDDLVDRHEAIIAGLILPDPDDHYVLATAIYCGTSVTVKPSTNETFPQTYPPPTEWYPNNTMSL